MASEKPPKCLLNGLLQAQREACSTVAESWFVIGEDTKQKNVTLKATEKHLQSACDGRGDKTREHLHRQRHHTKAQTHQSLCLCSTQIIKVEKHPKGTVSLSWLALRAGP